MSSIAFGSCAWIRTTVNAYRLLGFNARMSVMSSALASMTNCVRFGIGDDPIPSRGSAGITAIFAKMALTY